MKIRPKRKTVRVVNRAKDAQVAAYRKKKPSVAEMTKQADRFIRAKTKARKK